MDDQQKAIKALAKFTQAEINQIAKDALLESNRGASNEIQTSLDAAVLAIAKLKLADCVGDLRKELRSKAKKIGSWAASSSSTTSTTSDEKPDLTAGEINKIKSYMAKNCKGKANAMTKHNLLRNCKIDGKKSAASWNSFLKHNDGNRGAKCGYFVR